MPMVVIQTNATKVVVSFLLETTVESFDEDAQAAFTTGLRAVLKCHEPACAIDLVISPGSVKVDAVLTLALTLTLTPTPILALALALTLTLTRWMPS